MQATCNGSLKALTTALSSGDGAVSFCASLGKTRVGANETTIITSAYTVYNIRETYTCSGLGTRLSGNLLPVSSRLEIYISVRPSEGFSGLAAKAPP